MTNQQINIKIAELCGWEFKQRFLGDPYGTAPKEVAAKLDPAHWNHNFYELPNYAADLNACHGFEKTLKSLQNVAYDKYLQKEVDKTQTWKWHATARQRCEAFLRVHGQWEE